VPIGEISARPPKPRDPARIAALMSEVEKRAAARPKDERRAPAPEAFRSAPVVRADPGAVDWVDNHGVLLPADPGVFTPPALAEVRRGRFERRRARQRRTLVEGRDRLMEVGAGMGFLALVAARMHPGLTVCALETRADLAAIARALAAAQGLGAERLAVVETPCDDHEALSRLAAAFRPTVLVLYDAGAPPDVLAAAAGPGLRRVVIHAADEMPASLSHMGFTPAAGAAADGDLVLDRTTGG
jgi:hypothetical protein